MKSKYFVIKTLSNEKKFAKTSDEMTAEEFLGTFLDIAKEVYPITKEEYKACTGVEQTPPALMQPMKVTSPYEKCRVKQKEGGYIS